MIFFKYASFFNKREIILTYQIIWLVIIKILQNITLPEEKNKAISVINRISVSLSDKEWYDLW